MYDTENHDVAVALAEARSTTKKTRTFENLFARGER
jgi:hypothetical protein